VITSFRAKAELRRLTKDKQWSSRNTLPEWNHGPNPRTLPLEKEQGPRCPSCSEALHTWVRHTRCWDAKSGSSEDQRRLEFLRSA
jgi:hypothetical protein